MISPLYRRVAQRFRLDSLLSLSLSLSLSLPLDELSQLMKALLRAPIHKLPAVVFFSIQSSSALRARFHFFFLFL